MMCRALVPTIVALGCLAAPAALHAQIDAIQQGLINEGWSDIDQMLDVDKSWFQGLIDKTNWNLSAYPECTRVADAADAMLSNSNELWYWGELTGVYAMHKEYVTNMGGVHAVIFNEGEIRGKEALALETFLEEAAHHAANPPTIDPVTGDTLAVDTAFVMHSYESPAGPTDFRSDFATDCGKLKKKEDEDDDGPGGNTGTTTTCEEKPVYNRWTEYESESVQTGWEWVGVHDPMQGTEDNPVQRLVPVFEVVWKEVQKGAWGTETVCTTTMN